MTDYDGMIVPSGTSDWSAYTDNIELSRPVQGTVYRKEIIARGKFYYKKDKEPAQVVDVDDDFLASMKRNFDNRVVSYVQVPVVGSDNKHTEDPEKNLGEVVDLTIEDGKLYGMVDIRKDWAKAEMGKTLLGSSAMINLDIFDAKTGKNVGPALVHNVVTNNPYITDLADYEKILTASSDSINNVAVFTASSVEDENVDKDSTEEIVAEPEALEIKEQDMPDEKPKSQDELLAELKDKHGIDVTALQDLAKEVEGLKAQLVANDPKIVEKTAEEIKAETDAKEAEAARVAELEVKAAASEKTEALVTALTNALKEVGVLELSNTNEDEEVTLGDAVQGVSDLANKVVSLSSSVETLELANKNLEKKSAEAEIDALVNTGFILPAKKKVQLELRLSNEAMFRELLPMEPIVRLSNEKGLDPTDDDADQASVMAKVSKLMERRPDIFGNKSN